MLADHAARVLAGRTRLGAEARRVGGEPHRQLGFIDNGFAHEIGQGDFGGGNEPAVLLRVQALVNVVENLLEFFFDFVGVCVHIETHRAKLVINLI